ncbi:MAG: hypothetical protein AB7N71_14510 [Phycisphaerae bacterium]
MKGLVLCSVAGLFVMSARAGTSTFVNTFEKGINVGGWSYFGDPNNPVEVIEISGGNPGAFLHSTCTGLNCLDTFAPRPRTQLGTSSPFTGDYRARNVLSVGIDLILFDVDFSAGGRPLSVILHSDAGTTDPGDDVEVYMVGATDIPEVGDGWRAFNFAIPSQETTLPADWRVLFGSGDDNADWNTAITNVSQLAFFYGDPEFFFIFQQWEPGLDNPRIVEELANLLGDLNCDGTVSVGDIGAFVLALTDPAGYAAMFPDCDINLADINDDGIVSVGDIGGFVALLTGS